MTIEANDAFSYEKYFCAFIDVLGFRQLVQGKSAVSNIKPYFELSESIRANWQKTGNKAEIKSFVFSDSIFLAVKDVEDATQKLQLLRDFLIAAGQLQVHLALNNIWLRGAVTHGNLYCEAERSIVFGPGLVKAFDLEQRNAKYPRIIVDVDIVNHFGGVQNDEFISMVNTRREDAGETWRGGVLEKWSKGRYEFGHFYRDVPFQIDFLGQFLKPSPDFGNSLQTLVGNMMAKAREGFEAYEKMKWVADYLRMRSIQEDEFQMSDPLSQMLESI